MQPGESRRLLDTFADSGGELIEVVCYPVDGEDVWPRFLSAASRCGLNVQILDDDGASHSPEATSTAAFDASLRVSIEIGRQSWTGRFWDPTCLDLQGDPRDVCDTSDIDDIQQLMKLLCSITQAPVLLLPETMDCETTPPYLIVNPSMTPAD